MQHASCTRICRWQLQSLHQCFPAKTVQPPLLSHCQLHHTLPLAQCPPRNFSQHVLRAGLLRNPSITNPDTYIKSWRLDTRPQLDALWSVVIQTSNVERLLLALDALLMTLRSCRSLAVHIQQHHTDPAWSTAGEQVAADCARYERYISSHRAVAKRLKALHDSLMLHMQPDSRRSSHNEHKYPAQQRTGQGASILSQQQQLAVCQILLPGLQSCAVEDPMQWMAALELPDSNVQQLQQLQAQDRSLTSAIDSVLSKPVAIQLPAAPDQLLQRHRPQQDDSRARPCSTQDISAPISSDSAEKEEDASTCQQPQFVGYVGRGLLAALLQQCPDAAVHQQLHEQVLQPKLQESSRLLGQLARCRSQQARLLGHPSFFSYTQQQQLQLAAGGHMADTAVLLIQLQEALQPLCQEQVAWIMQKGSTGQQHHQQQQQQAQRQECTPSSTKPPTDLQLLLHDEAPSDWDYLQHQALGPLSNALQQDAVRLAQHLQLNGVLAGFSDLLQDLLGVQLLLRPAAAAEVWAPHVVVLDVVQQSQHQASSQQQVQALLGTVYVDIGGAHGARMLRYARKQAFEHGSSSSSSSTSNAAADSLPAVAVGISGSRLAAQQCQSDQEQAGLCGANTHGLVLSVSQLWELGHELGHAVHLIVSSRQLCCHMSGRFLPVHQLELPPQVMERLLLDADVLSGVCLHCTSRKLMPAELAAALAAYYGSRYNSALAVSARVATALAEVMYGEYGDDMDNYWRGAWEAASGLPPAVAAAGTLREVSLLPVMAAHQGTYSAYLTAWVQAAQLHTQVIKPLLRVRANQESGRLQAAVMAIFGAHVGSDTQCLPALNVLPPDPDLLGLWLWRDFSHP